MKNTNNAQEKMTFASDKLKILRKRKKGYTQEKISNLLEIGQSAYAKWENGRTQPNIDNIIKLANILDTTTDELLGRQVDFGDKLLGVKIENNQTAIGMFELLEEYLDDQCDNISFLESDYRAGYEQALEDVSEFVSDLASEDFSLQDMYDEYSRR